MIGLEYIAKTRLMKLTEIAKELGITSSTINDWVNKGKNIPKPRLTQLSKLFDLKEDVIMKEIDNLDKAYILDMEIIRLLKE